MTWALQGPSRLINYDETLSITRQGTELGGPQVNYVGGKKVARNPIHFELTCTVQPLDGKDLLLVPEGDRFTDQFWLYTNNRETPLLVNDRVLREAQSFQVQTVEQWGSFQRCRIMRVDVGPGAET